ncbi:microtubule associated protein-domain-containing protein [Dipodascopsis uninucleata]
MSLDRRCSYISSRLIVIDEKLQLLYDEIGISDEERNTRERNFYAIVSHALEEQVEEVSAEKEQLYHKCQELRDQIITMKTALQDVPEAGTAVNSLDDILDVRPPLLVAFEKLRQKYDVLHDMYSQRYERARELFQQFHTYLTVMDGIQVSEVILSLDPDTLNLTNNNMALLEDEVYQLEEEYKRRLSTVQEDATEIVSLWAQLGTSQQDIDRDILAYYKDKPELLGLSNSDIERLESLKALLQQEKDNRTTRLDAFKSQVHHLWEKLSENEAIVKSFDRAHRGIALHVIEAYEQELARLNEKKRDYMHIFIEDARQTLQKLWDSLYFSEEEMLEFTPAWTDIFTDASLAAHESEISRLEQLLLERKPVLALIDSFRELQQNIIELEQSQQDSSRLTSRGAGKRDPSRLLREEQMRKRIAKRKPKLMTDLTNALHNWEKDNGRPFLVNGERFLDVLREEELAAAAASASSKRTPARPTTSSVSRTVTSAAKKTSTMAARLIANEKTESRTPRSVSRRCPLQIRDAQQQNMQTAAPKAPNFLAKSSVLPPSIKKHTRMGNETTSPTKPGSALRHPGTVSSIRRERSVCSINSPLRMKASGCRSVSATIPSLSKLSLDDSLSISRDTKMARSKTAMSNYSSSSSSSTGNVPSIQGVPSIKTIASTPTKNSKHTSTSFLLMSTVSSSSHSSSESTRTLDNNSMTITNRLSRVSGSSGKASISNLVTDYHPMMHNAHQNLQENISSNIHMGIIDPDSRDDVCTHKVETGVVSASTRIPDPVEDNTEYDDDDFIDDYDDESFNNDVQYAEQTTNYNHHDPEILPMKDTCLSDAPNTTEKFRNSIAELTSAISDSSNITFIHPPSSEELSSISTRKSSLASPSTQQYDLLDFSEYQQSDYKYSNEDNQRYYPNSKDLFMNNIIDA